MNDVVISVQNLTKQFGDFTAVNKITFDVKRGEIFGFLGANGAGKTTTLRMLSGQSRCVLVVLPEDRTFLDEIQSCPSFRFYL